MFDFPFIDLYLNLLRHMQKCRFGPVIIRIATKKTPEISQSSMEQYLARISSSH